MANREEIKLGFNELNIEVSDVILDKCVELCSVYNVDAEEFCDQWYAFTASNLKGDVPTIENLEKMERKIFANINNKEESYSKSFNDELKIVGDYENAALTPQSKNKNTPAKTPRTQNTPRIETPKQNDQSFSSEKFQQRTDSKSIQRSYGAQKSFQRGPSTISSIQEAKEHKIQDFVYMCEFSEEISSINSNIVDNTGFDIMKKYHLDNNPLIPNAVYGRILPDQTKTLTGKSVLLEVTDEVNLDVKNTIKLGLDSLSQYSLFPGQIVAVTGNNVKNQMFVVDNLYVDAGLELPDDDPVPEGLVMVAAAGPFTFSDNLNYEPLNELIKYVQETRPHLLILMGPLFDVSNKAKVPQVYSVLLEDLIENIMNTVPVDTHVVIIPHHNDRGHHPVFPTPPFKIKKSYSNLSLVSNPGVVDVDGLRIAATTADTLLHIGNFELHYDKFSVIKSGRLERLVSHILHQKNIYPLCPPQYQNINVDNALLHKYGVLTKKPHILILPSIFKCFIKEVEDCLVINPEKLSHESRGGTFARIEIEAGNSKSICSRASVEILNI